MSILCRRSPLVIAAQLLFGLVTLLDPAGSSASTIIGMIDVRHDTMVLAADSKVRLDQVNSASSDETACKIVVGSDYAFALDGWVSSDLAKFDASEIAKRAVDSAGDAFEKAAKFDDLIKEPFFHLVQEAQKKVPQYYAQGVADERLGVIVVLAGSHNGRLSLELGGFKVTQSGIQPIVHELNEGTVDPLMTVVGSGREAIARYSQTHPEWRRKLDPVNAAKMFIQLAIAEDRQDVGPPISIVEIRHSLLSNDRDRVTTRWIEGGLCTDKKNR